MVGKKSNKCRLTEALRKARWNARASGVTATRKAAMPNVTPRFAGNRFEVRLVNWRVMLVYPDNTRHVVGIDARESTGRVSSAIKDFDPKTGRVNTYSRRVYVLVGSSRHDAKAQCVWNQWCSVNGVSGCKEITDTFCGLSRYDNP